MHNNAIKPQKRHRALVNLSRDHHHALLLVWKIKQGFKNNVNSDRVCKYVIYFFENDLRQHFYDEENTLFLKLNSNDLLKQKAIEDHKLIYSLIEKIKSNCQDYSLLMEFANELENHIRFEERTLFNYIQKTFSNSELNEIEKNNSNLNTNKENNWTDFFWVTE